MGSGRLSRSRWGVQGYAQDSWTVSPRLSVQYGARFDDDSFTGDVNVAPRGSFTVAVTADGRTVVRGGAGVFYDPIPLNVASFDQLQERVVTTVRRRRRHAGRTVASRAKRRGVGDPHATQHQLERRDRSRMDPELLRPRRIPAAREPVRVGARSRGAGRRRGDPAASNGRAVPLPRSADHRPLPVPRRGSDRRLLHALVGDRQSERLQYVLREHRESGDQVRCARPAAVGCAQPVLVLEQRQPAAGLHRVPAARRAHRVSAVDGRREPELRRRPERGGPLSYLRVARHAGQQAPSRVRPQRDDRLKVFNITNHFNPRDYQGNLASANYGGFANSVGRTFRGKWVFEF